MKKTAIILSVLLSLCSMTACGSTDSTAKEGSENTSSSSVEETTEAETTTEAAEEETTEAETSESEESKDEDAASDDEDEDKDSSSDEDDDTSSQPAAAVNTNFKRGVVEDEVYISEYSGIKFKAPEGWTFAKDDYILSMMNIGLDVMGNDNEVTKAMLDQVAIYDAMCMDQATGNNIIVEYENLAKEVPNPDKFTMDDYFSSIDKMLTTMSTVNYTKAGEPEDVTIAGKDFKKVVYTADYSGNTIEQIYYARRIDDFVQAIAFTSSNTSGTDMTEYEKCFEALD